jgi:protein-S-isoprenylcysteine O-methyltransferase Ste14
MRVKAWAEQTLGRGVKRWYRLGFVITAAGSLLPLADLVLFLPDSQLYRIGSPWRWAMLIGQAVAIGALLISVVQAGPMHFLGLAQVAASDPSRTGALQVRGMYRYVRHPLYVFSILLMWLTPTMTRNLAALFACMTGYFVVGSFHEERLLLVQFGEAYQAYRTSVPRFLPWPGHRHDA